MSENANAVAAVATREFYYFEELRDYFSYAKAGKVIRPTYRTIKKMFSDGLKSSVLGNKTIVFKDDLKKYLEKSRKA